MEAGELYLGEGKPSIRKAEPCLPPDLPLSPVRLGAAAPRPCARRFAALTASLPSFPAENSRSFGVQKCFRALLGALSTFKSIFVTSPMRFRLSGALPEPRAARFRASGMLPRLSRHIFRLWERSQGFPRAFPGFGSVPTASTAHFRASGVFPRFPRRVFSLWECSIAARCTALSFGGLPECSHRHCPRVARKSYKIFSSGG